MRDMDWRAVHTGWLKQTELKPPAAHCLASQHLQAKASVAYIARNRNYESRAALGELGATACVGALPYKRTLAIYVATLCAWCFEAPTAVVGVVRVVPTGKVSPRSVHNTGS